MESSSQLDPSRVNPLHVATGDVGSQKVSKTFMENAMSLSFKGKSGNISATKVGVSLGKVAGAFAVTLMAPFAVGLGIAIVKGMEKKNLQRDETKKAENKDLKQISDNTDDSSINLKPEEMKSIIQNYKEIIRSKMDSGDSPAYENSLIRLNKILDRDDPEYDKPENQSDLDNILRVCNLDKDLKPLPQ